MGLFEQYSRQKERLAEKLAYTFRFYKEDKKDFNYVTIKARVGLIHGKEK